MSLNNKETIDRLIDISKSPDLDYENIELLFKEILSLEDIDIHRELIAYLISNNFGIREGEVAVIRRGGLEETKYEGFNFSREFSEGIYGDPCTDIDTITRFALQEKYILDLHKNGRNPELKKEFLEKLDNLEKEFGVTTLSVFSKRYVDTQLSEIIKDIKNLIKENDEQNKIYDYWDIEFNGIDIIAKMLGFKGIIYWEHDDITTPSTYLIFDISILRKIPIFYKDIC